MRIDAASPGPMRMYWSSRSPFARKAVTAMHELGVADRVALQRVIVASNIPNAMVMRDSPSNKIPALFLGNGEVLFDSPVICEFLDAVAGGNRLFPSSGAARWTALKWQAMGDGLMEVILFRMGEDARPQKSESHLKAFPLKIVTILDTLEEMAPEIVATPLNIGHVTFACALSHLDFRYPDDGWRASRPALAAWHAGFAARPSMRLTEYANIF